MKPFTFDNSEEIIENSFYCCGSESYIACMDGFTASHPISELSMELYTVASKTKRCQLVFKLIPKRALVYTLRFDSSIVSDCMQLHNISVSVLSLLTMITI